VNYEEYVEVISNVRLRNADRLWDAWLKEHGLKPSDFQGNEVLQEVGRRTDGGSFSTFRIRRSALERLLPNDYGSNVIELPPQAE
jgi:hypothetical protein